MKIVTWNCNMAFRKKSKHLIEKYNPDVMLIQECEELTKLTFLNDTFNILWIGDNKNKGLAVFARKEYEIHRIEIDFGKVKYALAAKVDGIKFVNFWAMDDKQDWQQRYIAQVWTGLQSCKDIISNDTIVAGDFNWNVIWDKNLRIPLYGNLNDVVNKLNSNSIGSSYHFVHKEDHGAESQGTFFMYRKEEKKYHTDYIFVPYQILNTYKRFQIGRFTEWNEYSDHMPIFFEF